ncbi:hypothetical protein [Mangrovicella endophytica]|uniref:hypothetical protein n=1 Tax=Mangrovicella endophytica TaxID=2066697 RepID=UPI000C9EAA16|nr:hypothetical protein [Mangrovicella endophytica]
MRLVLCLIISVFGTAVAKAENGLAAEWRDLWTRCRIAIETGAPADTHGLINLGLVRAFVKPVMVEGYTVLPGYEYDEQRWTRRGSRLNIFETEIPKGGGVRRRCDVRFASWDDRLSPDQAKALTQAFLTERQTLLAAGRHEVRDPDAVPDTGFLGVGPKALNPNGCRVMSTLMIGIGGQWSFSSLSAEQTVGCSGPSLLRPKP